MEADYENIRNGKKKTMVPVGTKGITALWLKTGKKLDATKGCLLGETGTLVRLSDTGFLVIPVSSIVAVEAFSSSKDELDGVFNGQDSAETTV